MKRREEEPKGNPESSIEELFSKTSKVADGLAKRFKNHIFIPTENRNTLFPVVEKEDGTLVYGDPDCPWFYDKTNTKGRKHLPEAASANIVVYTKGHPCLLKGLYTSSLLKPKEDGHIVIGRPAYEPLRRTNIKHLEEVLKRMISRDLQKIK